MIDRVVLAVVESRRKLFSESSYIGEQEFFLLLSPFVALVRNLDAGLFNYSSSPSNFL